MWPNSVVAVAGRTPSGIPKIAMQTWKTTQVPSSWAEGQQSLKRWCAASGWTYFLMTDADNEAFVKEFYPSFWPVFRDLPYGIQRADAIRYMWLQQVGGLYLDLDFLVTKPLDALFQDTRAPLYVIHSSNVHEVVTNSVMACVEGLDVWTSMLERITLGEPWYAVGRHMTVMMSTGPLAFTEALQDSKQAYMVLPRALFMPLDVADKDCMQDGPPPDYDGYLWPLTGGTWNSWDSHVLNVLNEGRREFAIMFVLLVALNVVQGYIRQRRGSTCTLHT